MMQIQNQFRSTNIQRILFCHEHISTNSPHRLVVREPHLLQFTSSVQLIMFVVRCLAQVFHVCPYQHFSQPHKVAVVFVFDWMPINTQKKVKTICYNCTIHFAQFVHSLSPQQHKLFLIQIIQPHLGPEPRLMSISTAWYAHTTA